MPYKGWKVITVREDTKKKFDKFAADFRTEDAALKNLLRKED